MDTESGKKGFPATNCQQMDGNRSQPFKSSHLHTTCISGTRRHHIPIPKWVQLCRCVQHDPIQIKESEARRARGCRVMHFTLGIGKPWHWAASWMVKDLMPVWSALRERLPRTPAGLTSGDCAGHAARRTVLYPLPPALTLLLLHRLFFRWARIPTRQASSAPHGNSVSKTFGLVLAPASMRAPLPP